ncbi:hypothetical protein NPIL_660951 [Nephila pilipes]|uniref:RRM domain-containing protein n=1 Tax=Nephila pilipes TaxID=299642 RepID=A0A8X6N879_NEPPI|nr:hypothetical protein NPIL_660951 [Nephila pilipes]
MSIIIRLQNLPLSAKSGDIRHFFGGLRIPDGGVHIVGGEKGDAFIAFNSDEDARLAMRKDRGKLMGTRVKLLLSSHMEMQHEIERITKKYSNSSHSRLSPYERSRTSPRIRERSTDKHYYKSNSPSRSRTSYQVPRELSPHSRKSRLRSRSPRMRSRSPMVRSRPSRFKSRSPTYRTRSSRRSRSQDIRSRSPRMRSRSPGMRSRSPRISRSHRSISPISRSFSLHKNKTISPYEKESSDYMHTYYSSENVGNADKNNDVKEFKHSDFSKIDSASGKEETLSMRLSRDIFLKNEQELLEKKITEALKTGIDNLKKNTFYNYSPNTAEASADLSLISYKQEYVNPSLERVSQDNKLALLSSSNGSINKEVDITRSFLPQNINYFNPPNNNISTEGISTHLPPPTHMISVPPSAPVIAMPPINVPPPIQAPIMPPSLPVVPMPPFGPPSVIPPPVPGPHMDTVIPCPGFYITVSGLEPNWNFLEVQEMLKGTFVPMKNIKWEIDDHGLKTGTAFIKLSNKEDFDELLSHATYVFNNRMITVSECPSHVVHRYFLPEWTQKGQTGASDTENLIYRMKGLPYIVSYNDIINFFQGLDLTDIYVERSSDGKATGIGYVAFGNPQDYQAAFERTGKKIGHRCVHLMMSSKKSMLKFKEQKGDLLSQSTVLRPSAVTTNNPLSDSSCAIRRPLCALLTGLPQDITHSKIKNFFQDAGLKPDAIHITLNDKGRPNSRAFAEFNNVRDLESALKCHGTTFEGKIICVKQILFDEMSQILSTQRTMQVYENTSESSINDRFEKLPHIWQPPDTTQDKLEQFSNFAPTNDNFKSVIFNHENKNRSMVQVFNYENSREPTIVQNIPKPGIFPPQSKSFEFKHRSAEYYENSNNKNDTFISSKPIDSDHFIGDSFTRLDDANSNRILVKFDMKPKQFVVDKSEMNDAFDRNSKLDYKKKLTKLSPEKSSVPPFNLSLDDNLLERNILKKGDADIDVPSKNKGSNYRRKYKGKVRYGRRNEHPFKPSEGFHSDDNFLQSPHRDDAYSKSETFDFSKRYDESDETVVQISHVDPEIKGPELEDFFHGFDVDHDKITRRISNGKPTWDIRVTFRSYREAERAIRTFNGTYLNGEIIDMFIVN